MLSRAIWSNCSLLLAPTRVTAAGLQSKTVRAAVSNNHIGSGLS